MLYEVITIIEEINKEWATKHGEAWDSSDVEGMAFFKEKGGTVITLDDTESQRWAEAVKPVIDSYIKTLDDMKIDGKGVFDFIENYIANGGN